MNSRTLTAKKVVGKSFLFLFWTPVIVLSLLLIYNTLPYFTFDRHLNFLEERSVIYDKLIWRISFYVHIAAGALCIFTALLQFSSWILKKRKRMHIIAGKIYVFVVLLIGAPSGFYMTFFAKGGFAERMCFMFMGVFWFYSTYKGFVTAAREKNFLSHKFWMIRSYAMALTAVTFRVYHILFYLGGMSDFNNYSISLWISVLGNAAIAEAIIFYQSKNYLTTLTV
ncbi:MAG: DUF2306 domain-containing protein [Bacteroidia bacterium]